MQEGERVNNFLIIAMISRVQQKKYLILIKG